MNERFPGKAVVCTAFLFIFGALAPQAEAQVSISPVRIDLGEENRKHVIRIASQVDGDSAGQPRTQALAGRTDAIDVNGIVGKSLCFDGELSGFERQPFLRRAAGPVRKQIP